MPFSATRQTIVSAITLNKPLINTIFRMLVVLLPAIVLWYELSEKDNLSDIAAVFWQQLGHSNGWWLVSALLLIPFNWLAEVKKWRHLIVRFEPVSHRQAWNAILAGTSFAIFTPNRVGEYGARVLFVRPENQWKALIANLVGNASQYLVLLTGGVWGSIWFAGHMLEWSSREQFYAVALATGALAFLYYFYFNMRLLIPIVRSVPLLRRWEILLWEIHFLEQIVRRDLSTILTWSALRYLVYATQYVLLLRFFGIETGITAGYAGVATIYLLQTILPLPALAGLLVRGSLAVFVWAHFGANEVSSLAATFVLWIINLILPALIGTFSLFSVNITKSLGYEDD